jgi:hypothetical protein
MEIVMNIKSLITTFSILASTSTAALADTSFSVHAHGSVTVGNVGPTIRDHRTQPAPVVVRDHRYNNDDDRTIWSSTLKLPRWTHTRPTHPQPVITYPTYPRPEPQLVVSNPIFNSQSRFDIYGGWVGSTMNRPGFVPVTQATRINNGREHFEMQNAGYVDAIKIQAVRGSTNITVIGVGMSDGTIQQFQVNQMIDMRHPMTLTLDLRGGPTQIAWINVNGSSAPDGAFQILASS